MVVRDKCIKVTCGDATQRVRWLGHVGIARYDEKNYQGWKILGVPTKITNREGLPIDMGGLISDVLKDGDTVYVSRLLEPHDVERICDQGLFVSLTCRLFARRAVRARVRRALPTPSTRHWRGLRQFRCP